MSRSAGADDVLGLGPAWPRPGWAVMDAAREQAFTGVVEFQTSPVVRVCFDRGRVYLAERVTDPPLGARLVDAGALTAAELEHGLIRIGEIDHLGRLFERSPSVDRHRVMVLVEMMTDEATTWVAAQHVRGAVVLPYEMHTSGVHHWDRERDRTVVLLEGTGAALPPPVPGTAVLIADAALGDVDELADDVRIEWADAAWLGSDAPRAESGAQLTLAPLPVMLAPGFPSAPDEVPPVLGGDLADADSAVVALAAADDVVDGFEVIWPTGEVEREFPAPGADGAPSTPPSPLSPTIAPAGLSWNLRMPTPSLDLTTATDAELVDELAEEVAQAVRRAIAAITAADRAVEQHMDSAESEPGDGDGDGPIIVRSSTLTTAEAEAAKRMAEAEADRVSSVPSVPSVAPASPVIDPWPEHPQASSQPEVDDLASPWLPDPLLTAARPAPSQERTGALRRLIASLRRR